MCILGLHKKRKYQHHGIILKVNIRVLTFFFTKDNVHNGYALVFFIYLKIIKRVSHGLLQNTKAAKFPRKIARDQLRLGPASIHTRNRNRVILINRTLGDVTCENSVRHIERNNILRVPSGAGWCS